MKIKRLLILFASLAVLIALTAIPTAAQDTSGLRLSMSKTFGFAGSGQMQGTFKIKASGPEDLQRVVFLLDGEPLGEDAQAPFELSFNTDSHPLGAHTFSAVGYTSGGSELSSNEFTREFVSADAGWKTGMKIALPIIVLSLVAVLLSTVIPFLGGGKLRSDPPGTERRYGITGGAICPRCGRPFPLRMFAPNLTPGARFDRCPYCGKVGLMRRRSQAELRAAEQAEIDRARSEGQIPEESEDERLRRELDHSRYNDL